MATAESKKRTLRKSKEQFRAILSQALDGKPAWAAAIVCEMFAKSFIVKKQSLVSEFTGYSVKQISRLINEGLPTLPGGKYDLARVTQWLLARKSPTETLFVQKHRANLDKAIADAKIRTMEAARLEDKLCLRADYERLWSRAITTWSQQISSWRAGILTEIPPDLRKKVGAILETQIDLLLTELSQTEIKVASAQNDLSLFGEGEPKTRRRAGRKKKLESPQKPAGKPNG